MLLRNVFACCQHPMARGTSLKCSALNLTLNCRCGLACRVVSKRRAGDTAAFSERIVFVSYAELVGLFKAHRLSYLEYRSPAVYHAASSTLLPLNNVLSSFLKKVGICEVDALIHFKLAPLASRRDVAMLGAIHRAVLGEGPPQLRAFFTLDSSNLRRSSLYNPHGKQLECNFGSKPLYTLSRSILGLRRMSNTLSARIFSCKNVRSLQSALQQLLFSQAVLKVPNWQKLLSPRWPIQQHPF